MSAKVDLRRAERVWESFPAIVAVWSFGSAQDGIIAHGSDLDLAVLFSSLPNLEQLSNLRADLQEFLGVDNIDLMILNSAGTISGMEAVSGRALFCRDRGRRAEFVSLLARQYEDDMAFLAQGLKTEGKKSSGKGAS